MPTSRNPVINKVLLHLKSELREMLAQGVCGFKCFMIDSGVEEFPYVTEEEIRSALEQLKGTDGKLLVR